MDNNIQSRINISMLNLINICVDKKNQGEISGRLYHCYAQEPVKFDNVIDLLTRAEELFDSICYPQAATKTRCFVEALSAAPVERPQKVAEQIEVIAERGQVGSFVLCVQFRQNSTWQGEVIWLERGIQRRFSNTLDFIKILDSAVNTIG